MSKLVELRRRLTIGGSGIEGSNPITGVLAGRLWWPRFFAKTVHFFFFLPIKNRISFQGVAKDGSNNRKLLH